MHSILAKLEAIIYAAEEPIGVDQLVGLLKEDLSALRNQPVELSDPSQPSVDSSQEETHLQEEAHLDAGEKPVPSSGKGSREKTEKAELRALLRPILDELVAEYASEKHGIEIRQVAGGYRMSTKPEHHDTVRAFAKSLKPPIRLSLQSLETLAVIAYKQPVTVPEISEIRGVDAGGVIGTLMDRKLITTAGRKAVVGRPMLYKTTKEFLLRFGLKDLQELPSVEEFEKLMGAEEQQELFAGQNGAVADATGVPEVPQDASLESSVPDTSVEPSLEDARVEPSVDANGAAGQIVPEAAASSNVDHDETNEEGAA
jgi:segregation and condensation protein B